MRYDFAPMEGITDAAFRAIHHKHFPGVDRYFMPFLSPTIHRSLTPREQRELPLADSVPFCAVPQLLGKDPEDMLWAIQVCKDRGYSEVNLNLGCPSGTVFSKGKGSGMLRDPDALDRFLDTLFQSTALPLSIKTRIGVADPEEFARLLQIYTQYPLAELIVHPRVRAAFYKGSCCMDAFALAVERCPFPVCYNGNLNTIADIQTFYRRFPTIDRVMIGRGLVANPGLLTPGGVTRNSLADFVNELCQTYAQIFGSRRNAIFRMKENWHYLIAMFDDNEKYWKQLRKTTDYDTFSNITQEIIRTLPLRAECIPTW